MILTFSRREARVRVFYNVVTELQPELVRAIGRWTLTALMLNTIIGGGVAGLPSLLAAHLSRFSPAGYLLAALGVGLIVACLAEVASQFQRTGGPYLYARIAFGRFVAIQIGWLAWLTRIAAASAAADLFVSYLAQFFPMAEVSPARELVLALLIGFLAIVNYRGVSQGARVSNLFTSAKLLVLAFFICGGVLAILLRPGIRVDQPSSPIAAADWFDALLLMTYAYGGFEAALFVSGETRNSRKDAPVALLAAMITATILYVSVQYVVVQTLPNAASSTRPVADAAARFLGPAGASLIAVGTLIAIYGYLSANMLHTPRLTFAMGERGDIPAVFAAVHTRFRTPYVSIVTFTVMLLIFATIGNYRWNVGLSAVSRLLTYGSIVAALPVLRRKSLTVDAFRLPHANLIVTLALAFTGALVTRMDIRGFGVLAATFALAGLNWAWARTRPQAPLSPAHDA
jgi:APA family basic amino acid/polyamine antiporter